jgi:hypothetical protein
MKNIKQILMLLTGGLMVLDTFAADAPSRPLHVLYLGPVNADSGSRGFGGSRTNSALTHESGNPMVTGFFEGNGKKFFAKIC